MSGRSSNGDKGSRGGAEIVWGIVGYLVAGVVAWGGIGWLLDRWLGTGLFVPIGIVVGFAGGFYLVIRRYGKL
jgi:F0F1-type ATP synthase assembly protein I